jgi:penicillin-binding protein 1A
MRPILKAALLGTSLLWGVAVGGLWPQVIDIRKDIRSMASKHQAHNVAHPGWSFPARIWSDAASLELPTPRLMEHARLRNYAVSCPPVAPGEYCPRTGTVIPRGGSFPEGAQPPGLAGWSRAPALEPILVGYLVGKDGEIREHLPLAEAPKHLIDAIIHAEDEDFRRHPGVNPLSAMRAAWANFRDSSYTQGASTLTMQTVRVLAQRREKTLPRKIREIAMAVSLDAFVGKDGVLQMYLDAPYLGQSGPQSICGFRAAARHYWGVDVTELSLSQAATLAAILPAPGRFGPDVAPKIARLRRDRVLRRMAKSGYDVTAARAEPIQLNMTTLPEPLYPSYLQATRAWLEDHLPHDVVYGSGLEVFTALDVVAQAKTDAIISDKLKWLERVAGTGSKEPLQAAAALLDPYTGALVAAYGGTLEASTDFNRATQARRQAGSAFKPMVYALAFSRMDGNGMPLYKASDVVGNDRRVFADTEGWRPRNISGHYTITSPLANAIAWSQNVATASLLEELGGPRYLVDFAGRMGFDPRWLPEEMGLALGQGEVTPVEMAMYVATIINGGRRATGSPVKSARDAAGQVRVGAISPDRPVMTPEGAALTRELMRGVVEYGTGNPIRGVGGVLGYEGPAIGKTGTTDKELDLWFVGGTPYYAASLWMGYDRPARIGGTASELAAPLWGWWMRGVHEELPWRDFEGPDIEYASICTISGLKPKAGCRSIRAPFLPGTAPEEMSRMCDSWPRRDEGYQSIWRRRRDRGARAGASTDPGVPSTSGPTATGTDTRTGPQPL